jgi:hypothetical protein
VQGNGHFDPKHGIVTTDKDGRFEIAGLLPGVSFDLAVLVALQKGEPAIYVVHTFENLTWKPGEAKDLGTVTSRELKKE